MSRSAVAPSSEACSSSTQGAAVGVASSHAAAPPSSSCLAEVPRGAHSSRVAPRRDEVLHDGLHERRRPELQLAGGGARRLEDVLPERVRKAVLQGRLWRRAEDVGDAGHEVVRDERHGTGENHLRAARARGAGASGGPVKIHVSTTADRASCTSPPGPGAAAAAAARRRHHHHRGHLQTSSSASA